MAITNINCTFYFLNLNSPEQKLRAFESSVLRRVLGPKREVEGSWRKLHNDELHSLYSSSNIVRVMKSWRLR
jgi:hypothetical protein